jgi:hypothetical protein
MPEEFRTMAKHNKSKTAFAPENVNPRVRDPLGSAEMPDGRMAPDPDEIQRRAYEYWQERGCPEGCPDEDWYRAEKDLQRQS